ncbi:NAD-dependent epimerase/dehydratase family protein [Nonomuraea sp. NPDC049152]|uniref:NAD-dependent epimerase/dehydratase family protein n=1 Tax=Nonomuraea sp. NPDC049152 TaxID=3154350 RepID=UPI0033E3EF43
MTRKPLRYLLTGATGFVGGNLTRMILARGDAITALARPSARAHALRELGVEVVHGDLASGRGVREAVHGADRVIHLAAVVKARTPAEYWATNRDGTAHLAGALAVLPNPPRLVLCSSLAAAGPSSGTPVPVSHYGASKLAGEKVVRGLAHRVPSVILRPGIVYGPGEPALVPALLPMIRLGVALKAGLGPRRYCMVYVDDLCTTLLAAAERGRTLHPDDPTAGLYPISDGITYHWRDICAALARAAGRRAPVVLPVPMLLMDVAASLAECAGRIRRTAPSLNRDKVREMRCAAWTCTPERAVRELGFTPTTSLDRGLAAALAAGSRHPSV